MQCVCVCMCTCTCMCARACACAVGAQSVECAEHVPDEQCVRKDAPALVVPLACSGRWRAPLSMRRGEMRMVARPC